MSSRRIESFLLRLVVDDRYGMDTEVWRGRIQHVGSGRERSFERLQDIIAFINQQFGTNYSLSRCDDEPASET